MNILYKLFVTEKRNNKKLKILTLRKPLLIRRLRTHIVATIRGCGTPFFGFENNFPLGFLSFFSILYNNGLKLRKSEIKVPM